MSGKPYKNASDPEKFRNEYLETLNLRASVDKMNFDANQVYKQTGQLPAVSQIKDNRTTSEILADTQKLKIELIKELKPIAEENFSQLIIQKLEQSPLNADGSLFIYFTQRAPEIVKQLQKSYKYKIKGDMNDAETIVKFIENLYSSTKDLTTSVKSFFNNTKDSRITASDLDEIKQQYNAITTKLLTRVDINLAPGNNLQAITRDITRKMGTLKQFLNSNQYKQFNDLFPQQQLLAGALAPNQIIFLQNQGKEYIELLEKLPKASNLQALLSQLDKSMKNRNPNLSIQILQNMNSIIPDVPAVLFQAFPAPPAPAGAPPPAPAMMPPMGMPVMPPLGATPPDPALQATCNGLTLIQVQQICQEIIRQDRNYNPARFFPPNNYDRGIYTPAWNEVQRVDQGGLPNNATKKAIYEVVNISQIPTGLHGTGIKKRRGRPKGSGIVRNFEDKIDKSKGIQPDPRYISFGKHLINTKKLNDNIISLKTSKGSGIPSITSKKVSDNFGKIIKMILGGGVISNEQIKVLSPEEQQHLYKIAKCSDVVDKLNISSPDKDQQEKEFNQFEIMKGEIMSGNDSKELIRKFKAMLIKFSKDNKLPKSQVSEILSELIEMGY